MNIGWHLRRARRLIRRGADSVELRGWKSTLRHILAQRGAATRLHHELPPRPSLSAFSGTTPTTKRILIIDQKTPDPLRDSGSVRLCRIFDLLSSAGWTVDFVSDDNDASTSDIARLAEAGVRVHSGDPLRWLSREGNALDAVVLCRLPIADGYLRAVRKMAPRARVIFDTVDLHFVREGRAAQVTGSRRLARRAARSRRRELTMVRRCDATFVVSDAEQTILAQEAPSAAIECVSNIHDALGRDRPFESRNGLLFVGGFGHPPNEDAVRWFVREVLPRLHASDPTISFHVAGQIDDSARRTLQSDGVTVHGRVRDLRALYAQVRLSVAPLRFGAGVKGKVNQAMSLGVPVVLSTVAAEGMHLTHGLDAMIADEPDAMVAAIREAYYDPALWLRLSEAGLENVRAHFSPERARDALLRGLIGTRP